MYISDYMYTYIICVYIVYVYTYYPSGLINFPYGWFLSGKPQPWSRLWEPTVRCHGHSYEASAEGAKRCEKSEAMLKHLKINKN